MKPSENINFPAILAFSVHEMKNSLSSINNLIRHLTQQNQLNANKELGQLEFEANRMNNNLMQLLILYKIDESKFTPNVDECFAIDILNAVVEQQASLFAINSLELTIVCAENLICYCDSHLIINAITTVVNNSQRYARTKVLLSAVAEEEGYVRFSVEDDGAGYPAHFLHSNAMDNKVVNLSTGSTGLGLFFVATIAKMHVNGDKKGLITLNNHCPLGGAKFSLLLP
ncbi:MAG: HAMP domain-containing histidine kinase [Methylococcaceae bacterium]|nr:HAMP domain-containing histidine kinase [Methylococcaceae bacterium]